MAEAKFSQDLANPSHFTVNVERKSNCVPRSFWTPLKSEKQFTDDSHDKTVNKKSKAGPGVFSYSSKTKSHASFEDGLHSQELPSLLFPRNSQILWMERQ